MSKRFKRKLALDSVSLNVGDGEVVGLAGTDGTKKTTHIKVAAGLIILDSGDVKIGGNSVTHQHNKPRKWKNRDVPKTYPLYT